MADLVVLLIVGAGIGVLHQGATAALRLWRAGRHAEELRQRVELLVREGRADEGLRVARALPGATAEVVRAGLGAADEPAAESAMRAAARAELDRLGGAARPLEWAGAIAILAPLALGVRMLRPDGSPGGFTASLALLALGLGVAIAAVLVRFWLLSRLRLLGLDMEKAAAVVYNTAR